MAIEKEAYTVWSIPMESWDNKKDVLIKLTDGQLSEIKNESVNIQLGDGERIKQFRSQVTEDTMMQLVK